MPWGIGIRHAQWDLVKFIVALSAKDIQTNPRLLYRCFTWLGEGPQMDLLETLLSYGLDPGALDVTSFRRWPSLSSPSWIGESITPDPFCIESIRMCLQIEPGKIILVMRQGITHYC